MSSWLSISLPNPFISDHHQNPNPNPNPNPPPEDANSVLGNSIGRQLRGVAAFFAPPPLPPSPSPPQSDDSDSDDDHTSQALIGIKKDLAEIGSSISRLASNLLQLQGKGNDLRGDDEEEEEESGDDDDEVVAGTCDEVIDFVKELSLRPELWTGFPLELDNDFHMSDAQKEHASTIETLIPTFATLRRNTCSHLSEQKFWMIYFLLLLPRLHEDDIEVLSTPEILETRELLLLKLQQNKRNEEPVETSGDVIVSPTSPEKEELKTEEEGANASTSRDAQKQTSDEEEVEDSFSDLEYDKNDLSDRQSKLNNNPTEQRGRGSSASDDSNKSNDWVRLGESSRNPREKGSSDSEDSNGGWLNVDGGDLVDILPAAV